MAEEIGQPIHPYQHQKEHSETLGEDWWDDRRPTHERCVGRGGRPAEADNPDPRRLERLTTSNYSERPVRFGFSAWWMVSLFWVDSDV